jgi:hypothetical protein
MARARLVGRAEWPARSDGLAFGEGHGTGTGAAQPADGARSRYGPPPSVIPQVACDAGQPQRARGQATWPDQRAQAADGPLSQNLREEINDLRRQIAEMAMERDLLMRSMALWAPEATRPAG